MHGSKMLPTAALVIVLLFSSLGCSLSYDLVDVEEMLIEAEDFGRSLLQAAATNGAYGGYGNGAYGGYGGYGGYGAQLQSVTYRTECTNQTNPTNLQVFVAMLQPAQPLSNNEAAEGAASGMVTMYVDSRTGQAWVSGDINNIQNLTAVTVNAGNVTESGPVVLPLLPSASDLAVDGTPTPVNNVTSNETLIGALWNATFNSSNDNANGNTAGTAGANGGNTGQTQTPSVTVTGFNPPLPYLTNFMFSQKVYTNATVPLLANATVNNTVSNAGTGATQESAANSYNGQNNGQNNKWANISEIINTLGDGNVTVVTTIKYTVNGSTSDTNITGGNNTSSNNGGQESGSPQGTFNASAYNSTNILALLQSGLAYVSVWTAQSGNNSELRGQVRPYGQVVGASPTIQNAFPDSLVPEATYTTTTCRQVAVPVPRQERAARPNGNANGNRNNNIRAITTDVYGSDVVGNNYTAQAKQTLPGVATAMANITDGDDTNVKGNYSIFAAAVDAAARFVTNNNSNANNAAGAGSSAAATGRHLLQANTGSASTASANGNAAGGANAAGQSALANTGGTGGVTVFAPTNQAITRYLKQANITANELLANKTLLLKVISFHVVPNEAITVNDLAKKKQKTNQLKTLLPNNNVGYRLNQAGTATLFGTAGSSARIVDGNIKSGNVIVQGIDSVLVPPALRSVATAAGKNNESGNANTAAGGNSNTGANAAGRRLMKLLHLG